MSDIAPLSSKPAQNLQEFYFIFPTIFNYKKDNLFYVRLPFFKIHQLANI